ncbi:MAG: ATP-binding protein [Phycisphaerales bacterium]|nr:ATP-binding protein [Planctomycetota bacterium]
MSSKRPSNSDLPPSQGSAVVRHERSQVEAIQNAIDAAMASAGYSKASLFAVRLAFQEAIANAFNHGHRNLPPDTPARVEYRVSPAEVVIVIEDQGPGFQTDAVADCTLDENLEVPRGRGVMLIRNYMTEVRYNEKGNRIEMVYRRPAA